jgi:hypothetical protein
MSLSSLLRPRRLRLSDGLQGLLDGPPGDLGNVPPTWPTAATALDTTARPARSASTP